MVFHLNLTFCPKPYSNKFTINIMLKKHLIIAAFLLVDFGMFAQFIPRDWTLQVTTTVQTNPPAITFSWLPIA